MLYDLQLTISRLKMQHDWLSQSGQFIAAEVLKVDIERLEVILKQVEVLNE